MPKFVEERAKRYCLSCIYVECSEFGFSCRRHHELDDLGCVEDDAIVGGFVGSVGEEKVTPCAILRFRLTEI